MVFMWLRFHTVAQCPYFCHFIWHLFASMSIYIFYVALVVGAPLGAPPRRIVAAQSCPKLGFSPLLLLLYLSLQSPQYSFFNSLYTLFHRSVLLNIHHILFSSCHNTWMFHSKPVKHDVTYNSMKRMTYTPSSLRFFLIDSNLV
jgi:hypothetical protein